MGPSSYTVGELVAAVESALATAFPADVWVEGEINGLKQIPANRAQPENGRHVFFDLVEPGTPAGTGRPVFGVRLFDTQRQRVNRILRRYQSIKMTDGVQVRISGRLRFHRGQVVLHMNLIDPQYTLGLLAGERERVLAALAADGLLERNASLPLPLVPLRVGLVTSAGSAAAADFLQELRATGWGWQVVLADTRVQGPGADQSIAAAIRGVSRREVDVVVVVRGGGAKTELATFDSEHVARAIATAPVPVWTGIGHETDDSVADRVAHRALKTPTACAAALCAEVGAFLGRTDECRRALVRTASTAGQRSQVRLARATASLEARTRPLLAGERHRVDSGTGRLASRAPRIVTAERTHLGHVEAHAAALDPRRALARGWTITRTADGRLLRSATDIAVGAELTTVFAGGEAFSEVTGVGPGTGEPDA